MTALDLARRTLDPGLFSDNASAMQDFYVREVGLPLEERLEHSDTYAEIFFSLPEGKLKVQASSNPMEPAVSGYRQLVLARPGLTEARALHDPDGLSVRLVPVGDHGVTNVGVVCAVRDPDAQRRFLIDGMGAKESDDALRVGDTQIFVEEDVTQGDATPPMRRGFTYITLIVHGAEATCRRLIAAGAQPSLRMLRLDDRCLFSWVRDPHGNWLEIVQYAHLSGPLPEIDRIADNWDEVIAWREEAVTR